jgi:RNA polymerase sigma factor (sigma-70 family)
MKAAATFHNSDDFFSTPALIVSCHVFFRSRRDTDSDEQLIESFRKTASQDVLAILFSRYTAMIYGVCLKYLKDRNDAQDATMQLFEKLGDRIIKHEIKTFRSWLYVMARNECLMQIRAKKGKFTKEFDPNVVENELLLHPVEEEDGEADLARLERCIETLAGEQKACVKLFYLEEMCYKDIAAKTGFDAGKVKSYIQNGKRNLKLCMDKEE